MTELPDMLAAVAIPALFAGIVVDRWALAGAAGPPLLPVG